MAQLVPAKATNIVTNLFRPPAASLLVTAIAPSFALLAVGDPSILTLIGNWTAVVGKPAPSWLVHVEVSTDEDEGREVVVCVGTNVALPLASDDQTAKVL